MRAECGAGAPSAVRMPCCRYTAFIVLYPVGVLAEIKSVWDALPLIKLRGLHSVRMPNVWNFGFDYHTFLAVRVAHGAPSPLQRNPPCSATLNLTCCPRAFHRDPLKWNSRRRDG